MKTVIVIPTYNEKENITRLIDALLNEFRFIEHRTPLQMNVLIVDDTSPDGTGEIVEKIAQTNKKVFLLTGTKQGLGKAYIRGFQYAMDVLHAEVVMEMDADFSHNPQDVLRLLMPIYENTADFVIGSRYINGGSIPESWSTVRKLNSHFGNVFARYVAGIYKIHDCTAGFRAIRVSLLKTINIEQLKVQGYSFQMNLLYAMVRATARIKEVPVHFVDRTHGESKIRMKDISEFIINSFMLRFSQKNLSKNKQSHSFTAGHSEHRIQTRLKVENS